MGIDGDSKMCIEGIIFDFGNVICRFDNWKFIRRIASASSHCPDTIHELLYVRGDVTKRYERGEISSISFFLEVRGLLDLEMEMEEFKEAFTDIFEPVPGTIDLIRSLADRYRLGLISNTNEWDHQLVIRKLDIFRLFDAVSLSHLVGKMKPDERIYLDCLDKLGLRPQECIYIDDIKLYTDRARDLGMVGIQFTDEKQLLREMRNYISI